MSKEKLQDIKDEVAQENEWSDWANMDNSDLEDCEVAMARQEMITELMKLAYNQALYDSGESVFNMTAYTHRSQDYQHGWEDCQIEAQRKIEKLKI